MKKTRFPIALSSLILFAGSLAWASPPGADTETPRPQRSLKVALTRDVRTWDPARINDPLTHEVASAVYETLYQQDAFSKDPVLLPLLAADYPQFSKDGRTVVIRVRDDVKFNDHACFAKTNGKGREVAAEDFVRALKRLAIPGVNPSLAGFASVRLAGFEALRKRFASTPAADLPRVLEESRFDGAHALDAHTLVLRLSAPWPRLSGFFSFLATAPFPHEWTDCVAANEKEPWIDRIAIGTGPFRLSRWVRGQKIELERNPSFHADFTPAPATGRNAPLAGRLLPFLSRLDFEVVSSPRERLERFLSGEFDRIPYTPELRDDLLGDDRKLKPELRASGFELLPQGVPHFQALLFGHGRPPISVRPALRRAIAAAISRKDWAEPVLRAAPDAPALQGAVALTSAGFPPLDSQTRLSGASPDKASKLLAEAGYGASDALPPLTLDLGGTDPTTLATGESVRAALDRAGIRIRLRSQPVTEFLHRLESGDFELALATYSLDAQGPEYVFQLLHGPQAGAGANSGRFRNAEFDRLYSSLLSEKSGDRRKKIARQLAKTAEAAAAWVPGFTTVEHFLVRSGSSGFRPEHFLNLHWRYWSGR